MNQVKCYFACVNDDNVFPALFLPVIPRIGEMLFFEGETPAYKVIDVQYQFRMVGKTIEFVLINIVLKKVKGR